MLNTPNTINDESLQQKIITRVWEGDERVFMRRDFSDLGSVRQIDYALGRLVAQEKLVRVSQGFYARAKISPLDNTTIVIDGGLIEAGKTVLRKLGYEICPSSALIAYNAGLTTQVPSGRKIAIRASRKPTRRITYRGALLYYECRPNA